MGRFLRLSAGVARSFDESSSPTIYDQVYTVSGTLTAGTSITLPASGTYQSDELEVYLNGQRVKVGDDYQYVGSGTRTQIQFTFDLLNAEQVRFRVDRGP